MLKSFSELMEVDVTPYCEYREGKDEKGNKVKIPYLPWAACLKLLYQNGAEKVDWYANPAADGSPVIRTDFETTSDKGRVGACYFVNLEISIDDKQFNISYPILNGTSVVYKDTLNQLRVNNAMQRAFVKCVAMHTGLGLSLWIKGDETDDKENIADDPFQHNPMMVKEAIERVFSAKLRAGKSKDEILSAVKITDKQYSFVLRALENAAYLLNALSKV